MELDFDKEEIVMPPNSSRVFRSLSNENRIDLCFFFQLVDLHVLVIPRSVWNDRQNFGSHEALDQAISLGFVR